MFHPARCPSAETPSAVVPIHELSLRVLAHRAVTAEYRLLTLATPETVLRQCQPGQFFHLLCPEEGLGGPYFRRPMSIYAADPELGQLSFLYKVTGKGTRALSHLRVQDQLDVLGPLGQGFSLMPHWRSVAVLGRGVGLATLGPLVERARVAGCSVFAICSARSPRHLMSVERFRAAGAEVLTVTNSEGTSGPDHLRQVLSARHDLHRFDAVFTCGSSRLVAMLQDFAAARGLAGQVAVEQDMACGLGLCHACVRPIRKGQEISYQRVCREGPVFALEEV